MTGDIVPTGQIPPEAAALIAAAGDLQIGKISCKPGDIVLVRVGDNAAMPKLWPMCDMLQKLLPPGVRLCMIGPDIDFSVITREQLDAHEREARGRSTQQ